MSDNLDIEVKRLHDNLNKLRECKGEVVLGLKELADNLDKHFKKIAKAKVFGSVTSIGGGILAGIGFGLSFATFGASLGLTLAGSIIAGAGGATVGGSMITDAVLSIKRRKSAQDILDEYNTIIKELTDECIEIGQLMEKKNVNMEDCEHWIAFWKKLVIGGGSTTKCVTWNVIKTTISTSLKISAANADEAIAAGARAGTTAFKALGTTAGRTIHIAGGVVGIILMPLDIYTLVDSALTIHKNKTHKVSSQIRKWADEIDNLGPTKDEIDTMIDKTFK
ncbi:unnamed protein product [Mytilus coruscus]|uniref:APOL n=1 Tax=Mytilus coruscus TaxID=42192 RepID=A0A6J8ESZ6_MYTCO|nr:unnamed protein product [Mytilus coruscus]